MLLRGRIAFVSTGAAATSALLFWIWSPPPEPDITVLPVNTVEQGDEVVKRLTSGDYRRVLLTEVAKGDGTDAESLATLAGKRVRVYPMSEFQRGLVERKTRKILASTRKSHKPEEAPAPEVSTESEQLNWAIQEYQTLYSIARMEACVKAAEQGRVLLVGSSKVFPIPGYTVYLLSSGNYKFLDGKFLNIDLAGMSGQDVEDLRQKLIGYQNSGRLTRKQLWVAYCLREKDHPDLDQLRDVRGEVLGRYQDSRITAFNAKPLKERVRAVADREKAIKRRLEIASLPPNGPNKRTPAHDKEYAALGPKLMKWAKFNLRTYQAVRKTKK